MVQRRFEPQKSFDLGLIPAQWQLQPALPTTFSAGSGRSGSGRSFPEFAH
jgi:hypothetical protein